MAVLFSLNARLSEWLTSPAVLRLGASILRRHRPVLCLGSRVFIARHADVRSVLEQSERFGVTEIYDERMKRATGAFLLGWENTPAYQREVSLIRAAVPAGDLARVRAL